MVLNNWKTINIVLETVGLGKYSNVTKEYKEGF